LGYWPWSPLMVSAPPGLVSYFQVA
jgi:hypothetical protein